MENLPKSILTKKQTKQLKVKWTEGKYRYNMTVNIRYDDQCGNGHNSFSITADIYENGREYMFGCCHDEIVKHCPELKPFIKWHLTSSDGPWGYVANTLYHARNTDCDGLAKGEYNSFTYKVIVGDKVLYTSRTFYTFRNWLHRDEARAECEKFVSYIKPELNPEIVRYGRGSPSEGKAIELEAARNSAVWPDAKLSDLTKENLEKRLPKLMQEFKKDVESLGFTY